VKGPVEFKDAAEVLGKDSQDLRKMGLLTGEEGEMRW